MIILLMLVLIALATSPALAGPAPKDVPWEIGPAGNGRLPAWRIVSDGATAEANGKAILLKPGMGLSCLVNRDWSGYRNLDFRVSGGEGITAKVTLVDSAGISWTAQQKIKASGHLSFPFDQFRSVGTKMGWLDLATLQEARIGLIEGAGSVLVTSIALSGSKGLYGPGVNMDVAFEYYSSKPWAQIIQDAKNEGFTCIHLVDVNLQPDDFGDLAEKVAAIRAKGLTAILTIYPTTDHVAYEAHPEWRQKSLNGSSRYDWRTYLCPNNEEFAKYLDKKVTAAFKACSFDGLELAEPWFEIWGGPEAPKVGGYYTCVCDHCRAAFKGISGQDPMVLFEKTNEHYFRNDAELYGKWVRFRVDSLERFMLRLYAAAKKVDARTATATMQVSDCRVDPGRAREYQGQDFDSMVTNVVPNALVIESAWQDWLQPGLEPTYIADYGKAYVPRRGKTRLLSQCDIGSSKDAKRGIEWLRKFSSISTRAGFDGYVAYEYSVGLDLKEP